MVTNYRLGWCAAADAVTASDWLCAEELASLDALAPKRRRDRLAGRVAAKRALKDHFRDELGWDADPRELVLANDEAGRPVLRLPRGTPGGAPSFSIAHAAWGGLCAVAAPGERVGCDLESVVARPREVLAFVAAPDELGGVEPSDPVAQTRLWTGKEAVLKLLGLGLDADARMVEVRAGGAEVRLGGLPAARWAELGRPRLAVDFTTRDGSLAAVARTGGTRG
ncbi:MAG: 4'-phosphopantetheinyl transferase superfamily protein [Elusimicrobiota bacterium]|nr:4'-phosphopantetheinyl transferase superfamily protein [Elusimicrobiota bacterium]